MKERAEKRLTGGRCNAGKLVSVGLLASLITVQIAIPVVQAEASERFEDGLPLCPQCEQVRKAASEISIEGSQVDRGWSAEDVQLLKALQFENWRFMSLTEFRDRAFNATETSDYRELFDRLTSNDEWMASLASTDLLSFVCDVLLPLMSDSWLDYMFSGEVYLTAADSLDKARIEYTFRTKIDEPKKIRVGDYQDSVAAVPQAFRDLFLGRTQGELQDVASAYSELQTFFDDWITYAVTPEMRITDIEYVYFPPDEIRASWDGHMRIGRVMTGLKSMIFAEGDERRFDDPSADDYVSLLELKTPNYEDLSLAEFNYQLLQWADEDLDRSERIAEAVACGTLSDYLTNDERAFIELTTTLSGEENHQLVVSEYTGEPSLAPTFDQYLPQRLSESGGLAAWCELYYQYSYDVLDSESVTVGERDAAVTSLQKAIVAFWEHTDFEKLLAMDEDVIADVLSELAEQYSTTNIRFKILSDQVHFESMDERHLR